MKLRTLTGILATALAAACLFNTGMARADGAAPGGKVASIWIAPKDDGKVCLTVAGVADPVATCIADGTVVAAVCLDCGLPMEFPVSGTAKSCAVCGCSVSNAQCVVGKPVKGNGWQTMFAMLPKGTVLIATFNDPAKPEAGIKKLAVDLRHVLLPVTGLDGQTPEQLLAIVKPLGGTKAELIDSGKRLSITLKADWTIEKETKLEKALEAANAKVATPDAPKPAQ